MWDEVSVTPNWQCLKCTGECVCKACKGKRRSLGTAPAPAASQPTEMEWQPEDEEEEEQEQEEIEQQQQQPAFSHSSFSAFAPERKKKSRKRRAAEMEAALRPASAPLPRGPSPPQMHASFNLVMSPANKQARVDNMANMRRPVQRVGLGILFNTQAPPHLKILELQQAKESCESTIQEMQHLLRLMELEKAEIEGALTGLISEAIPKPFPKSASACSLEELEASAANALNKGGANLSVGL